MTNTDNPYAIGGVEIKHGAEGTTHPSNLCGQGGSGKMTDINQSIIADAIEAGFNEHPIHGGLILRHSNGSWIDASPYLAKFAELTLKRNGGEAVGYVKSEINAMCTKDTDGNFHMVNVAHLCSDKVKDGDTLYLSPPQPQTVASALEKAIEIHNDYLILNYKDWLKKYGDVSANEALRALITNPTQEAQGWKLVPLEPTQEMLIAGVTNYEGDDPVQVYRPSEVGQIYRDMIKAAPNKGE